MAIMIAEIYDALREAGASEEKSRRAAEAVASFDNRFRAMDIKFERLDGRVNTITWMIGATSR